MVLFYDNDTPAPVSKRKKYFYRIIKIILLMVVLLSISMWVLASLGGNSNALRLGIQDYLTDSTGYLAEVKTLHDMSFFPISRINFEDLTLHQPIKKEPATEEEIAAQKAADAKDPTALYPAQKTMADYFNPGETVARVGKAQISMGFWDMFLSRRRFLALDISDVYIGPNIWLPEALTLTSVKVIPDVDFPAIVATGTYGTHKLDIKIKIGQEKDKAGTLLYRIPDETPISVTLGPLMLEGIFKSNAGFSVDIKSFKTPHSEFSGSISMVPGRTKRHIIADLKTEASHIVMDLETTPTHINGSVTAPFLDIRDITSIRQAYKDVQEILGLTESDDRISFGNSTADIKLEIEKLMRGSSEWGSAKADMTMNTYNFDLMNITGLINGGALKGHFKIDATGKESLLESALHLRGWDYARLQNQVTGQADTHMTLSAKGTAWEDFEKNMTGEMVTVGGEGELSGDTVLYWGSGLLNAMLPKLSGNDPLKMNCMVADFNIQGYRAEAQTLFMDLKDLTVVGTGSVNLEKMTLDLMLKPNPKEISILDGGVAVNVTGPIESPKIQPDRFSMGKKIGSLLLGTINPAFFALSLTDLGLNETHPCRAYIK